MPFNPGALAEAAASPGWDEPPPPSTYESLFRDFDIFESKAGKMTLRLSWRVLSGPQRDHEWSHVQSLEELDDRGDPNPALPITARILETMGVDIVRVSQYEGPRALNELRRELEAQKGSNYEVEVKRNGAYVNTTPKSRIGGGTTTSSPSSTSETSASGIGSSGGGSNAIYQGDGPPPGPRPAASGGGLNLSTDDVRRDVEQTGESDVPADTSGFESPPQKGDIDPETGEPIPF
jgi:hypothetical protein